MDPVDVPIALDELLRGLTYVEATRVSGVHPVRAIVFLTSRCLHLAQYVIGTCCGGSSEPSFFSLLLSRRTR